MTYYQDKDLTIRPMLSSDCQAFYESFAAHDWYKPLAQFQRYFQEQEQGVKRILVAAWPLRARAGPRCRISTCCPPSSGGASAAAS